MSSAKVVWDKLGVPVPALFVSCQAVPDGPFDTPPFVCAYAVAAQNTGAHGLRLEGVENVKVVSQACSIPIIGIVKRDLDDSPVRITPFLHDVEDLAKAGAKIIAVDATKRIRPVSVSDLIKAIHQAGCLAMADISTLEEAKEAIAAGADIVGTTMSGYTGGPIPDGPDLPLVKAVSELGVAVIAEGRLNSPEAASAAIKSGAHVAVVGSAISRPEYITQWYLDAINHAGKASAPVLSLDIGGTKTLVARVHNGKVTHEVQFPTARDEKPDQWIARAKEMVSTWPNDWESVAAAVTGVLADTDQGSVWKAFNPATLNIPEFALSAALEEAFAKPAFCLNDAQAAAWGEYRWGAGKDANVEDMLFITVSTGIGGGLVLNGKLRVGENNIAGHLGQWRDAQNQRLEDLASGTALGRMAMDEGWRGGAVDVVERAKSGEEKAIAIRNAAIEHLAQALSQVQLLLDVPLIVVGGGLGLSEGFIARLQKSLERRLGARAPQLKAASLDRYAGIIGAADAVGR